MAYKYNIASFGHGVLDIVKVNGEDYNYFSGGTAFNILKNLSTFNYNCSAYGIVGNDLFGEIVLSRLKKIGINIDNLTIKRGRTNVVFIDIINNDKETITKSKITCPQCLKKYNYLIREINNDYQLDKIDVAIFDNLSENRIKIANCLHSKKRIVAFDLGYIGKLKTLTRDELKQKLFLPYTFIQINGKVVKFIFKKLELTSLEELYEIVGSKYLITTNGEDGSYLTYNNGGKIIKKDINFKIRKVVDTCGAGDAFLSGVIASYLESDSNEQFLKMVDFYTQKKVKEVITKMGATGYLQPEIIKNVFEGDLCLVCGYKRKRVNLLNNTCKEIENKIRGVNDNFKNNYKKVIDSLEGKTLVVGTGASYTTASFIEKYLSLKNKKAVAIYPRDLLNYNLELVNNVIFCSYSGKTSDIEQAFKRIQKKGIKSLLITNNLIDKGDYSYLLSYFSNYPKSRGFISLTGILIPCYYLLNNENLLLSFLKFREKHYELKSLKKGMLIDVFYDSEVLVNVKDIDSKVIESGLGRVSYHEKKDFSHGRFITYRDFPSDLTIILNYQATTFQTKLLTYLKKYNDNIIVFNKISNDELENIFLNLVQFMYFFKKIGDTLKIDLSSPGYTDFDLSLYQSRSSFL